MCSKVQAYAEKYAKDVAINECIRLGIKHNFSDKKNTADLMADHHLTEDEAKDTLWEYKKSNA